MPNQRIAVRHRVADRDPEDLAKTTVAFRNGVPLRLGDVADVKIGFPPPIGDAVITVADPKGGKPSTGPGLLLIVEKQPTGNTLEVTRNVEKALDDLRPGLKGVDIDPTIFRPATFIERSLDNLREAMIDRLRAGGRSSSSSFLFDWRTALISLTAIPLSLIAATLVLVWLGRDDQHDGPGRPGDRDGRGRRRRDHRRREHRPAASAEPARLPGRCRPFRVVLSASLEVRSAVVYASLIVILVFMPVFFLEGLSGSFFRPLALAYVLAIVASLLVALTVTPALSLMLLTGATERRHESPLVRGLKAIYRAILPAIARRPGWAIAVLVVAFAATGWAVAGLGEEFLPDFQENDFLMHWIEKPGTSLEAMRRITENVSKELLRGAGRAQLRLAHRPGRGRRRGRRAELHRALDQHRSPRPTTTRPWRRSQAVVDGYPGLLSGRADLLERADQGGPDRRRGDVVVRIFGPDMAVLRDKAQEVDKVMEADRGGDEPEGRAADRWCRSSTSGCAPRPRRRLGLTAGDVRRAATTLVKGTKVGELYTRPEDLRRLRLGRRGRAQRRLEAQQPADRDAAGHARAALRDVAEIAMVPAPNEIKREGASRRIDVTCNVARARPGQRRPRGRGEGHASSTSRASITPSSWANTPPREESRRRLMALAALSLLGVLLIIHADFRIDPADGPGRPDACRSP